MEDIRDDSPTVAVIERKRDSGGQSSSDWITAQVINRMAKSVKEKDEKIKSLEEIITTLKVRNQDLGNSYKKMEFVNETSIDKIKYAESNASALKTEVKRLATQVSELTASAQDLKNANVELSKKVQEGKEARRQLDYVLSANETLTTFVEKEELKITEQYKKIAKLQEEGSTYSSEKKKLQEENHQLMVSLKATKDAGNALEEELKRTQNIHKAYVTRKEEEVWKHVSKIGFLEDENKRLTKSVKTNDELLDDFRTTIEKMTASAKENQLTVADLSNRLADAEAMKDEVTSLKTKYEMANSLNRELLDEREELTNRNDALEETLKTAKEEMEELCSKVETTSSTNKTLLNKLDEATNTRQALEESLREAKAEVEDAKAKNEELNEMSLQLQTEMQIQMEMMVEQETTAFEHALELENDIKALTSSNEKINETCTELESKNKEQQSTMARLSCKLSSLKGCTKDLEYILDDLNTKVKDAKNEKSELNTQLQEQELQFKSTFYELSTQIQEQELQFKSTFDELNDKLQDQEQKFASDILESSDLCGELEQTLLTVKHKLKESRIENIKLIASSRGKSKEIAYLKREIMSDIEMDIKKLETGNVLHGPLDEWVCLKEHVEELKERLQARIENSMKRIDFSMDGEAPVEDHNEISRVLEETKKKKVSDKKEKVSVEDSIEMSRSLEEKKEKKAKDKKEKAPVEDHNESNRGLKGKKENKVENKKEKMPVEDHNEVSRGLEERRKKKIIIVNDKKEKVPSPKIQPKQSGDQLQAPEKSMDPSSYLDAIATDKTEEELLVELSFGASSSGDRRSDDQSEGKDSTYTDELSETGQKDIDDWLWAWMEEKKM